MRRIFAAIVLLIVLVAGGGLIANTAYQAGLSAAAGGGSQPLVVPAYGFGYGLFGLGFGFLGFLGTLFFLFLVFALLRVLLFGGRRGRPWGRGGPWSGGHGSWSAGGPTGGRDDLRSPWEARAHATFEAWHRAAHDAPAGPGGSSDPGAGTPAGSPVAPAA